MNLPAIQAVLRERNMDAWLFYDHHHRDPIAYRVLGIPAGLMVTRRWFYVIPAKGEPVKLVHKIESGHLDTLPGSKLQYAGWQELFDQVKAMLSNFRDIAMQYSPNNLVFYVSLVDGGTLEMIRGLGPIGSYSRDIPDRLSSARRRSEDREGSCRRGTSDRWMGSRSSGPRTYKKGRLRRIFHSSHRAFHRHRCPCQRRQHGRSRGSR